MSRFCGSCGTPAEPGDRFCPGCGKPVEAPAPQAFAPPPPPEPPRMAPPPPPPAPAAPTAPEIQWHYSAGGQAQGPVPESVLRNALQSLPADTLVWHAGLPGWKSAAEAGLKAPAAPVFNAPPRPAYNPQPAFQAPAAAPVYGGFGQSAGVAAAPAPTRPTPGGAMPPDLHWALVLILSWVTFGLGGLVWAFKEASFVKRIDPASKAVLLLTVCVGAMVVQVVLMLAAMNSYSSSTMAAASGFAMLLNLVVTVAGLVAVFSMRSSIERYYNSVEPIGLRLSGVMTFFFSLLYFQYHFSRIAAWKKTGQWR